ncbi:unnamed protein product [Blepharisma stoltei]|uniref:HMG box domain-containing protein n=1 Tax=Blepharisma stoltei TaxID=1481888 RepID=A0AAU9JFP6_9CILI|nr:unnamed protein product [Blepharisma stoltei]
MEEIGANTLADLFTLASYFCESASQIISNPESSKEILRKCKVKTASKSTHHKSGYQLYYNHRLADLKAKPDFTFEMGGTSKLISAEWKNLSKDEQEVWKSRAEEEKKENSKSEPASIATPSKNKHSDSEESGASSESDGEKKHKRKRDKKKDKKKSKSDKKSKKSRKSKNESESSGSDKSDTESDHSSGRKKKKKSD